MTQESGVAKDGVSVTLTQGPVAYTRSVLDGLIDRGLRRVKAYGPSDGGFGLGYGVAVVRDSGLRVVQAVEFQNLITQNGDQVIMERYADIGTPPDAPTGMRLGANGSGTAAAKTGAGAAIAGTYITGSHSAFEGGFPTSSLNATSRRITFEAAWAAGTATNANIDEWVVTNESPLTDVTGTAGNTVSRATTGTDINKTASDTLTITWTHDFEGT